MYTADRSAQWDSMKAELCGTQQAMQSIKYGEPELYEEVRWWTKWRFFPSQPGGLMGFTPSHGHSGVYVPGRLGVQYFCYIKNYDYCFSDFVILLIRV